MSSPSNVIDQKDIQQLQDDFCKFVLREVLSEEGSFYYYDSEYATDPKFEALRAGTEHPFDSFLS
jgi:hypothetical protein